MIDTEIIALVANLGALSVAGILYIAYIKNLRSQIALKAEQIATAEQNVRLWKDRTLQLERQTPQYVEQVLTDRIRIREEEIARLANDELNHRAEIARKSEEVQRLKKEFDAAHAFGRGISVYDRETRDIKQLSASELTLVDLGYVWVDWASIIISDPGNLRMSREREIEEFKVYDFMYRVPETGETFYLSDENKPVQLEPQEAPLPAKVLVAMGLLEQLDPPTELPANPDTYIQGDRVNWVEMGKAKLLTFYNGSTGAGICFCTGADGRYNIKGESYDGKIRRIFFDLF